LLFVLLSLWPAGEATAADDAISHPKYRIGGAEVAFTVTAGTLAIGDDHKANLFYVAYVRDGAPARRRTAAP
jgi:hypothetical protein